MATGKERKPLNLNNYIVGLQVMYL